MPFRILIFRISPLLLLFTLPPFLSAASFPVTTTADNGLGSLRQAILNANATPGPDVIVFAIGSGPQTISLASELPTITDPVAIRGDTQPGFGGAPIIELNGSGAGMGVNGLRVTAGGSSIWYLVINRFQGTFLGAGGNGIMLEGSSGNGVHRCHIGTDRGGTAALPNTSAGLLISGSSLNMASGNVLSGNGQGLRIEGSSTGNSVVGNFIGTNAAGTADLGNIGDGIEVSGGSDNRIGTTLNPNIISGNDGNGVTISGTATTTMVDGNRIGTNLSGAAAIGNSFQGVLISVASNNYVGFASPLTFRPRNIISGNGAHGVRISNGASGNRVQANHIGTNLSGNAALGNAFNGVIIEDSSNNSIGGSTPEEGNILSGNGTRGVRLTLGASGNGVGGNWIGLSVSQTPLPNLFAGVGIDNGAVNNFIGSGFSAGGRNFISGNAGSGIILTDVTTSGNSIEGNTIGMTPAGAAAGNALHGVHLDSGASGNFIGMLNVFGGNTIAFNSGDGVFVEEGTANSTRFNRIRDNVGLGVDLAPDSVTANDPGDSDAGPNNLQNFPLLVSASSPGLTTIVQGTLASAPNTLYKVDFYWSPSCDPSGQGEGENYLDTADVTTDGSGNASFIVTLNRASPLGSVITATATDPGGNTSEFSNCVLVPALFYTVTPCRVADTRDPAGPYGGPALSSGAERSFLLWNRCGVPATARAVSVNLTVTEPGGQGHLTLYPAGPLIPPVSTINYSPGQTRANNAIVTLGQVGELTVRCVQTNGLVHAILDVNGYFE